MSALPGGVITTIPDPSGSPVFQIYEWFDPSTGALVDKTVQTSTGAKTGALIVDNLTGKTQQVRVAGEGIPTSKTFSIPTTGVALTAAQLAANSAKNGGPITSIADLAGISPVIT